MKEKEAHSKLPLPELFQEEPLRGLLSMALLQSRKRYQATCLEAYALITKDFIAYLATSAVSHTYTQGAFEEYLASPSAYLSPLHMPQELNPSRISLQRPILAYACSGDDLDLALLKPWQEAVTAMATSLRLSLRENALSLQEQREALTSLGPLTVTYKKALEEFIARGLLNVPASLLASSNEEALGLFLLRALGRLAPPELRSFKPMPGEQSTLYYR